MKLRNLTALTCLAAAAAAILLSSKALAEDDLFLTHGRMMVTAIQARDLDRMEKLLKTAYVDANGYTEKDGKYVAFIDTVMNALKGTSPNEKANLTAEALNLLRRSGATRFNDSYLFLNNWLSFSGPYSDFALDGIGVLDSFVRAMSAQDKNTMLQRFHNPDLVAGHVMTLNALLKFGADPTARDVQGMTVLAWCAYDPCVECLEAICESYKTIHGEYPDVNVANRMGYIPMDLTQAYRVKAEDRAKLQKLLYKFGSLDSKPLCPESKRKGVCRTM
jgi:hypothetical protein